MRTAVVTIPADEISDWDSFHTVFAQLFGFPPYYGRNMDAWIDCMTYLDDADAGMTTQTVRPGDLIALRVDDADHFRRRCPEQYEALVECSAFVNFRRVELGGSPILTLALVGRFSAKD